MNFSDEQLQFCAQVRGSPRQILLRDLISIFVPHDFGGTLQRLHQLQRVLLLLNLETSPDLLEGGLDSLVLISTRLSDSSNDRVQHEIASGEGQRIEFKSSFFCCTKTLKANPNLERKHYIKPEIENAALTAFAGLMNAEGGVVLIGVSDSGDCLGLEADFFALNAGSVDRWLLQVKQRIESRFLEGRSVNSLIDFSFVSIENKIIARAAVRPRQRVVFLRDLEKPMCPPRLLVRAGNQTVNVQAPDLEAFFEQRVRSRAVR